MWLGLTIARSRPASTQWCRKTELRTARAPGETPKETFETPSEVFTCGISALIAVIPAIVSTAEGRHSSSPVVNVNVRQSKISSSGSRPCSSPHSSRMRLLLYKDGAQAFGNRKFVQCIRLFDPTSIMSNRLLFILQVELKHFLRLLRGLYWLRRH